MPQKNAFIIDEDREFAKRVAAALSTDGLKVGIAEEDRDPIEELNLERPDIILMRADGREGESGFALCGRMKKQQRLADLPIFLYSAEADDQTFEHHRQQEGAADAYIHFPSEPPYPMEDLVAKVNEALAPSSTDAGEESDKPPPLPPPREPIKPITEEDTAFLDRVLDSLQQNAGEEENASAPPLRSSSVTARRTTADAKLDMLRQKLRQREFELAKVMEMYRAKEREYHEWNEKLVEKDVEAQALKVTIEDFQRTAEVAQGELDRRTAEFNASFEQLLQEKVDRENELINTVAIKEKEIADVETRLAQAQTESAELGQQLEEANNNSTQTAQAHQSVLGDLRQELDDRESTLASLEQALADTQDRVEELEALTQQQSTALEEAAKLKIDNEALIMALRGDLADAREKHDEATHRHGLEVRTLESLVEGLQGDLDQAEASFAQLESDLKTEIAELSIDLASREERLRSVVGAQTVLEAFSHQQFLAQNAAAAKFNGRITQLSDSLDAERIARAETEAQLEIDLERAQAKIASLNESISDLEMVSGERLRVLGEQVEDREDRLAQFKDALEGERERFQGAEAALKETIADLENRRASLQVEVDQRLSELADTEAAHAETIGQRDAIQSSLEGDLRASQDEVASLHAEIAELQVQFEELERAKAESEAEFQQEFESQAQALASTRDAASAREAQMRDQFSALEGKYGQERTDRDTAERRAASLQHQLESTSSELMQVQTSLEEKVENVHQLRETVAVREGRIVELQEGLRNENAARQSAEMDLVQLRADHDARNEKIGRLEGQMQAQEEMIETLRVEAASRQDELESLKEGSSDLRAQLAVSQAGVEERTSRLDEVLRRLGERDEELTTIRSQLSETSGLRDRAWEAKEHLQRQLDEARREWTVLREELVNDRHHLNQRLEAMQRDLEGVRTERDGLLADKAQLEELRDVNVRREDDLRIDLEARIAHTGAVERELDTERASRQSAEDAVERLRSQLNEVSTAAQVAAEAADHQKRELEMRIRQLTDRNSDSVAETDQVRRAMSAELDQARAEVEVLTSQVSALSADKDGLGSEATTLSRRLDDAMARSSNLASEKAAVEERRVSDVRRLEQLLRQREEVVTEQKAELQRLHDEVRRINADVADVRRERDDVENKYVRELEELHDEYRQKAKTTDVDHAREVESLRKAALDAKRQLKTSQLTSQRLEERLRRSDAERTGRSDASKDFESFIAQFSDAPDTTASDQRRRPSRSSAGGAPRVRRTAAEALGSSAAPLQDIDKEEDVTDVGGQILPGGRPSADRTSSRADTNREPRSSRRTRPLKKEEPDDFLVAFDKEFEDIKGG
ncbi:MAG: hypothetical protein AAFV29_00200 [Myxococcota bacterium]